MKRARETTVTATDQHVATRLKAARLVAGLSQENAGEALGVSFQQIQKYERGTNRVSAGTLAFLAALYKRPLGYFFDGAPTTGAQAYDADARSDIAATLLSLPHGRRMAEAFVAIEHSADRATVASVAEAVARRTPRLQAVG